LTHSRCLSHNKATTHVDFVISLGYDYNRSRSLPSRLLSSSPRNSPPSSHIGEHRYHGSLMPNLAAQLHQRRRKPVPERTPLNKRGTSATRATTSFLDGVVSEPRVWYQRSSHMAAQPRSFPERPDLPKRGDGWTCTKCIAPGEQPACTR
jgi:hypothetical protein